MFTTTRHLIVATALAFQAATALPAAGPNDDAEECWTSQDAYRLSVEYAIGHSYTELVSTEEWVSTSTDSDVPLTTLCDGKARALEPYKTVLVTVTETLETPTLTTFTSEFTGPSPTCTIGESECSAIVDAHPTDIRHSTFSKTYPPCAATSAQCDVWDGGHSTLVSGDSPWSTLSVRGLTFSSCTGRFPRSLETFALRMAPLHSPCPRAHHSPTPPSLTASPLHRLRITYPSTRCLQAFAPRSAEAIIAYSVVAHRLETSSSQLPDLSPAVPTMPLTGNLFPTASTSRI
jgi:hypothetical protein